MQGIGKIFVMGVPGVYHTFFKVFETTFLPGWLVWSTAYFTSYAELICGFLLIVGLFRKYAMYILCTDLLIVSFGHGIMEPVWDLQHVMARAALLISLLLLPEQWDRWHIDHLITPKE